MPQRRLPRGAWPFSFIGAVLGLCLGALVGISLGLALSHDPNVQLIIWLGVTSVCVVAGGLFGGRIVML